MTVVVGPAEVGSEAGCTTVISGDAKVVGLVPGIEGDQDDVVEAWVDVAGWLVAGALGSALAILNALAFVCV